MSADIRALLAEASPAPWGKLTYGTASTGKVAGIMARAAYATSQAAGVPMTDMTQITTAEGHVVAFTGNGPHSPENAALIAALRNRAEAWLSLEDAAREAMRFLDLISPSGWHVERARDALREALVKAGAE